MERPNVLIISDEASFAAAVTSRWMAERNVPSFAIVGTDRMGEIRRGKFSLAVAGRVNPQALSAVIEALEASKRPAILVSNATGRTPRARGIVVLPETADWSETLFALSRHIIDGQRAMNELEELQEMHSQLEQHASLGRYMLEVRHNLNNALTSVLGNSDLILLDQAELSPAVRVQVETIRNMGMRMNEIMHRFSSLQKEMQLVEQENWKKSAAVAAV